MLAREARLTEPWHTCQGSVGRVQGSAPHLGGPPSRAC